jgi:hypothetical protein
MANVKEVYPPVPECGGLTWCKSNCPAPARHSLSDAVKSIVAHDVRSAPQRKRRERLVTSAATRTIRHFIIQQQIREPETHVVAIPEGDQASKPRVASCELPWEKRSGSTFYREAVVALLMNKIGNGLVRASVYQVEAKLQTRVAGDLFKATRPALNYFSCFRHARVPKTKNWYLEERFLLNMSPPDRGSLHPPPDES